jgi:GNAT superfamily N-acetyltransferase
VVGYYAISTAVVRRGVLPTAKLRKGMPEEVPLLLIGRLALDEEYHGRGLGTDLLADALRRCLAGADVVGARGVITHAIDDEAVRFYQKHGFALSPLGERTMLLPMETVAALFRGEAP